MHATTARSTPETRTQGLIVQEVAEEVLVYDEECHKAHCLKPAAALVWLVCHGNRLGRAVAVPP